MGSKVELSPLTVEDNSSYQNGLNQRLDKLADEFDNVVYRDGSQDLQGHQNANSKRIYNLGTPVAMSDAARLQDVQDMLGALQGNSDFALQFQKAEHVVVDPTESQFEFSFAALAGYVSVYLNGVKLATTDYTHNGAVITLNTPAVTGDIVALEGFTVSAVVPTPDSIIYEGRTLAEKLEEALSVKDFGVKGDGIADDTSSFAVAIAAADTTPSQEKTLIIPAGIYRVGQINLEGRSNLTLHCEGTVQIIGIDGSKGFIVGGNRFDRLGHTEDFTSGLRVTGGPLLIGPASGQNYARGLKLQNFVDCVFENVIVSGTYTPTGGTGNRISVELELSFNNGFYNCQAGYPGAPIGAAKSYGLWLGGDNCNNNRFYNYRGVGGGYAVANTIGVRVDSAGNSFFGADISAIHTMFELNHARGALFSNYYGESVSRVANVTFASRGCVFMPAYLKIEANGTAYDFGSDGDHQTIGFQVIGGNHTFSATGTTLLKKGGACYGLTFQPGIEITSPPSVNATGTDRGSGGTPVMLNAFETSTAKINFPDTPVPSDNPTTLDAYKEGAFTPNVLIGGSPYGTLTEWAGAVYTKIGRVVTVNISMGLTAAGAGANEAVITGLPFPAALACTGTLSLKNVTYTGTPSCFVAGSTIYLLQTSEAGVRTSIPGSAILADNEIQISITYTATE